jgi:DNA-binding protein HU-beta
MNKNDLSTSVAESTGLSKKEAAEAVDAIFDIIVTALTSGEEVKVVGFGSFVVRARPATTGRNPRTGEAMTIAASKRAKFRASAAFKSLFEGDPTTEPFDEDAAVEALEGDPYTDP